MYSCHTDSGVRGSSVQSWLLRRTLLDVNLTQNGAAPGVSYPTTLAAPRRPQVPDPHPAPLYLGSGSDAHMVQFYHDDGFLLDDLGRFFGSALEAGDAAIIIATRPHRGRLARRLKARGLNLSAAAKQGRYVALDAAETLSKIMLDGLPHAARFVKVVGSAIERATELVRADRLRV